MSENSLDGWLDEETIHRINKRLIQANIQEVIDRLLNIKDVVEGDFELRVVKNDLDRIDLLCDIIRIQVRGQSSE